MSTVILHRVDAALNMHRFYRLDIQLDLFGQWCVAQEWGRIGKGGQARVVPFPTSVAAQEALDRHRQRKERRGYR